MKIPNGQSDAVVQRTAKTKRNKDNQWSVIQSNAQKTKDVNSETPEG